MPLVTTRTSAFGLGWGAAAGEEELGGMVLLEPTSIAYTGTSASIGANGSVEFTACTSLSLNGVFTADYDNYNVIFTSPDTGGGMSLRYRSSGTDQTTSTYTHQNISANSTTLSLSRVTTSSVQFTNIYATSLTIGVSAFIYGPYLAQPTAQRSTTIFALGNATIWDRASTESSSISFDGFTLSSGLSCTGLVSVYGLVGA